MIHYCYFFQILENPRSLALQLSDWTPPPARATLDRDPAPRNATYVRQASFSSLSDADSSNDLLNPKFCTQDEGCFCWRCFNIPNVDGCDSPPESEADTDEEPPRSETDSSRITLSPVITRQNAIAPDNDEIVSPNAARAEIAAASPGIRSRGAACGSPQSSLSVPLHDLSADNPVASTSRGTTSGRKRKLSNLELWRRACPSLADSGPERITRTTPDRPKAKVAAWRKRRRLHFQDCSSDSDDNANIHGTTASSASHFEVTVDYDEQNQPTDSDQDLADVLDISLDETVNVNNLNVRSNDTFDETDFSDQGDIRTAMVDEDVNVNRRVKDNALLAKSGSNLTNKHPRQAGYIPRATVISLTNS